MIRICEKKYYRIVFELVSPLALGSGDNEETDKDILADGNGNPYIPGSSMAGVYRSYLEKSKANEYFGRELEIGGDDITESKFIIYDAEICKEDKTKAFVGKRDMVGLDEYKVASKSAKFDMQILEPGIRFVTYIEQNLEAGDSDSVIDDILFGWKTVGLSFGAKTMRGYGKTKAIEIKNVSFKMPLEDDTWLDFDVYDEKNILWKDWEECEKLSSNFEQALTVEMELRQTGGISVREYSTKVDAPDYEQLKLHGNDKSIAIIPGTSWAGAFRAQMKKLGMDDSDLKAVFGKVEEKSHIAFSESQISDGVDVVYTRNAIDRFSGGTVDGALYKDSTRYYGNTSLKITCDDREVANKVSKYLAACIVDLDAGYMAVGGLTAIGRGMFKITKLVLNGADCEVDYQKIVKAMGGEE